MLNIIISGCTGRMGQTIEKLINKDTDLNVICGFGQINDKLNLNYPIYENPDNCTEKADIVIDFSNVNFLDDVLNYCVKTKTPLVLATTGFKEEAFTKIIKATETIPIFQSYNMSLGISLLKDLAKRATKILGSDFDIEIIDKHHNQKVDSPSGTTYLIANTINEALDDSAKYVFDRHSENKKREPHEIGIHSIRGGSIVGEHTVLFAGNSEVIELTHKAESKELFAVGAIKAAKFLINQPKGIYNMDDLFKNN